MYMEYVRNQRFIKDFGHTFEKPDANPIYLQFQNCSVPEYKPTWLVRVSDMQVVPGSSVNEHYWALSYSWNQSGKLIHKGGEDYDRIDEGRHQITEYQAVIGHRMKCASGRTVTTNTNFDTETASTKLVTFKGFIRQICKDFAIHYIWYDQMCINQSNHKEKMLEIKQMHLIYANALCTVALVPEFQYTIEANVLGHPNMNVMPYTQWCKRMWTLEEAYVSRSILFLGRNVHIWSDANFIWASKNDLFVSSMPSLSRRAEKWIACTVLWYARNRTSSKAHDRIFALANIFPEFMDVITFSYYQPLHNLTLQFYRALAHRDVSVLWFGVPLDSGSEEGTGAVRQEEERVSRSRNESGKAIKATATPQIKALPSWTTANGVHVTQFALHLYGHFSIMTPNCITIGDYMHITSSFITVRIAPANMVQKPGDFDDPNKYLGACYPRTSLACKKYDAEDGLMYYYTEDGFPATKIKYGWTGRISCKGSNDLIFATIPSKSHRLYTSDEYYELGLKATHILPLILEDEAAINTLSKPTHYGGFLSLTEECSECIILSQCAFESRLTHYHGHPIVKKDKDCYRSIGVFIRCTTEEAFGYFFDLAVQPEQTFDIR